MKTCKLHKDMGRIHSFESFGSHEGPGIRYVVFLQGCIARCLYCQNPDTWPSKAGEPMTAKEVFKKIEKAMPYIRASGGGVTISGGEPLLQPDFLTALFRLCRKSSVHTAVDTSGFFSKKDSKKIQGLLNLTDLFIMDIKSADAKQHKRLTARELKESLFFIAMLEKKKRPYWLRYVLVPGSNDSKEDIRRLNKLMQPLRYCQRFEFLPYHTLGSHKWAALGLRYPLKDARSATTKDIDRANRLLNKNE